MKNNMSAKNTYTVFINEWSSVFVKNTELENFRKTNYLHNHDCPNFSIL